ncbi:hypothetical protein AOLI_G00132890 [Acnodon oligacanthus]
MSEFLIFLQSIPVFRLKVQTWVGPRMRVLYTGHSYTYWLSWQSTWIALKKIMGMAGITPLDGHSQSHLTECPSEIL